MATADIYLDLEQLKSEIIAINIKKLKEIDKAMKSSCNTVAKLTTSGWIGDSKDAFMEQFTKHKQNMRCFYEYISEFNKQLRTIHEDGEKLVKQRDKLANEL